MWHTCMKLCNYSADLLNIAICYSLLHNRKTKIVFNLEWEEPWDFPQILDKIMDYKASSCWSLGVLNMGGDTPYTRYQLVLLNKISK